MTDPRKAMTLALEALKHGIKWLNIAAMHNHCMPMHEAITQLKAALAAQGEKREPVGFMWQHEETGRIGFAEMNQKPMWEQGNPRLKIIKDIFTHPDPQGLPEPEAIRTNFDGYGWQYIDNAHGSGWKGGIGKKAAEFLFTRDQLLACIARAKGDL